MIKILKLLVVDDEAIIRQGILRSVDWERLNIRAFEANNGLTAYDMLSKDKYDIVLLDIKMPGLTGLELIEKVRTSIPDMEPVFIILSGYAEFSLANQAMKFGVKYYLLKPTDLEEIYSTLEKVISEMKAKNFSYHKIFLLNNKISHYVQDSNIQAVEENLENLFTILKECEKSELLVNYCTELFILIIRQCKDTQQIPKFLKMSSQINTSTSLDEMYSIIFRTTLDVIDINKKFNLQKFNKCIQSCLDYITENISDKDLSLTLLSKKLFMNPDYLGKLFKREMNENFNDYLSAIRIKKAEELIQNEPNSKICDIAERVGFGCNSQYFSQIFKKYTGYTPKEYKALIVKDNI